MFAGAMGKECDVTGPLKRNGAPATSRAVTSPVLRRCLIRPPSPKRKLHLAPLGRGGGGGGGKGGGSFSKNPPRIIKEDWFHSRPCTGNRTPGISENLQESLKNFWRIDAMSMSRHFKAWLMGQTFVYLNQIRKNPKESQRIWKNFEESVEKSPESGLEGRGQPLAKITANQNRWRK